MHTRTQTCTCRHMHTHMRAHTHAHRHTHTHTFLQTYKLFVRSLWTSVNAIWSPTQMRFDPGLKNNSVPDPNVIRFWTQCDLVLDQNAIWSQTQMWFGPGLKPDGMAHTAGSYHSYEHSSIMIISWLQQSHYILWSLTPYRWTGRLTDDCSDMIQ